MLKSIGPVWDGNEVWLLAAGGTLYFAFPALYASSFSGFYLPLMIVLWLLILRGIVDRVPQPHRQPSLEALLGRRLLRRAARCWPSSSARPSATSSAACRSTRSGDFFLPLWTNFAPGPEPGILDWYTVLVGLFALRHPHPARRPLGQPTKTADAVQQRSVAGVASGCLVRRGRPDGVVTVVSFQVQPQLARKLRRSPRRLHLPRPRPRRPGRLLIFRRRAARTARVPRLLPLHHRHVDQRRLQRLPHGAAGRSDPRLSLTIHNAAAPEYGLRIGSSGSSPASFWPPATSSFSTASSPEKSRFGPGTATTDQLKSSYEDSHLALMAGLRAEPLLSAQVPRPRRPPSPRSTRPRSKPTSATCSLWGPNITVAVADPQPAPMPGYQRD